MPKRVVHGAVGIAFLAILTLLPISFPALATTVDVSINNFQFIPDTVTIVVGDAVRWTNNQQLADHTSTSDNAVWDSGTLTTGQSYTFTFNNTGSYPYHCFFHPTMHGMVIVNPVVSCCLKAGDANHNGSVNVLDVTYLVNFLYKSGTPPPCSKEADANGNGTVNVLDVTYLINFLYKSGSAPVCGP